MFQSNPNYQQPLGYFKPSCPTNENVELVYRAVRLFNTAVSRGRFARVKRWITGTPGQLLDLNKMPDLHARAQHYGGVRPVLIENIRGSLGRAGDFDCDFNPLDGRLRERWQRIAMAYIHHVSLKPVELIQVDERYFVKDGHHRISVARALGQCAIDAEVTVWEIFHKLPEVAQPVEFNFYSVQNCS